ncbi:MAG TPA: PepSY domain-containing protein [Pyrinomonadaceae bacterium]|nr:PepSY domain-containing protein [Pyrinomonadaceae bacterium]
MLLTSFFTFILFGTPFTQVSKGENKADERANYPRQSFAAATAKSSANNAQSANSPEILLADENDNSFVERGMRISAKNGFPKAIYQSDFRVAGSNPETQARQYLTANRNLFGLAVKDIENLRLHAVRTDETGTTVRLRQIWQGLAVNKNAEITIHINREKIVDFVMNGFVYGIKLENIKPEISASDARQTVVNQLGTVSENLRDEKNDLMIFHYQDTDYLVYRVNFTADDQVGDWEAFVDAKTGNLLKLEDIALYYKEKKDGKIRPASKDSNAILAVGTGNVFDPDPLTTSLQAYGGSYVDGSDANAAVLTAQLKSVTLPDITLSAGTYSLVGPYAAIIDHEAPNKGLFTQASSSFAFDRNADNFEAVNCYYHIDSMMRYLNVTLGLSIQPYQYGGGVRFDPSGLSGADNSHYTTGNGSLAFGEGGVDDAEDADVIIHELGHGLHDWVTAGGLSQVNGLSEGTGDYIAGSYSRFKGGWTSAQAAYNWTFNWDGHNPFWGGRILNYGSVYPAGLVNQVHTDGQIWATANMKIWDDIGRQKADKAFWRGLSTTNSATNQNDAANAVYLAARNLGYSTAELLAMRNRYTAAGYTISVTTAANSSVAGKVKTNDGRGLTNALVLLTNANGNTRSVRTSSFGNYRFDEVASGETYTISVISKRFQFTPQIVSVNDNVTDLDFTANGSNE